MANIAVIGAGITGITTAYALLDRGHAVTVLDRQRYPAMETSFANGGQLSACHAEAWHHWTTVAKGARWMLRRDAPLLVNPRPTWHKLTWLAEFLANMPNYRRHTVDTTRLALAARERLFEMAEREGIRFDLERRGILHFYRDRAGFEHARALDPLLLEGGLERREVTPEEMRALEPALPDGLYGGFFTESDASGDAHEFTRALAQACARRGAALRLETEVLRLRATDERVDLTVTSAGERTVASFERAIICAGVESRRLARMAGDRVNVYPVKGYSITLELPDERSRAAAPWVSLLDDGAKIVSSRLGRDRLRVAGTAELDGFNRDIRADRIRPLIEWTERLFPDVATSAAIPWAGLRPMLPGMLPRIGRGRAASVLYNTGHGHLGWTLSAATAYLVSDLASGPGRAAPARIQGGGRGIRVTSGH